MDDFSDGTLTIALKILYTLEIIDICQKQNIDLHMVLQPFKWTLREKLYEWCPNILEQR